MSDVFSNLVADHIEATLGTIVRKANGYYYDLPADQIFDIKVDLETEGHGDFRVSLYSSTWDNKQQGTDAAYNQTHKTVHFHLDGVLLVVDSWEKETSRALADLERAVMKDISQGGTCINTFVTAGQKFGMGPNNLASFTLSFDAEIRHAANDPSAEYQTTYN